MKNWKIQKNIWKNEKKCMKILSLFTNLILLFSWWAGPFPHIDELGVSQRSWACPRRELGMTQTRVGVSQTSRGKSQPIILIVNFFLFLFFELWVSVSVSEFSEVLPPPTFSSVRVGGVGVVVVLVLIVVPKLLLHPLLSSLFLWMLWMNEKVVG